MRAGGEAPGRVPRPPVCRGQREGRPDRQQPGGGEDREEEQHEGAQNVRAAGHEEQTVGPHIIQSIDLHRMFMALHCYHVFIIYE